MRRRIPTCLLLTLLLLTLLPWAGLGPRPARCEDGDGDEPELPHEVPVAVSAEVDAQDAADLGRYRLTLVFVPEQDLDRAYRIEVRVTARGRELLQLDHSPEPATPRWRAGQEVRYEIPVPVPFEAGLEAGQSIAILVGFFDPEQERTLPVREAERTIGGRVLVAEVQVPELGPTDDEATIARIVERARVLAEEGRKPDAWKTLERGLRRAEEDVTKARFRDAILDLGHFPPSEPSLLEKQIVERRITAELHRHLRKMAGRYYDRGHSIAALRVLEIIGGKLAEQSDAAVIGALAAAERAQKDIQEIRLRLLARIDDEDKEKAQKAIKKLGPTEALLKKAEAWFKDKAYARARVLLRSLSTGSDRELAGRARQRLDELEATWLAETPKEDAQLVEDALHHPAFERLATVATHNFLYIGPRTLVENIPNPSRLRFDLSYVFLTDLFGRLPNPGGDRITVFFKELWDFGGGQAGGRTIDIGRADPKRRGYRVDTGLLYHELTHCVDDTIPIFAGWREGLANVGAAYSFEALGQKGDELHAFERNLKAFEQDYLGRDLAYWRIPGYGPSAGFFLHFLEAFSSTPTGHDWKPYRGFFRAYRTAPVHDGREPYVARAFAWYLVQAFGDKAFDELVRFRLPLIESDREAIRLEVEGFARGEYRLARMAADFMLYPNSPLPRDLRGRTMVGYARSGRAADARELGREKLGILYDWRVIGPFREKGADPRVQVFPPEQEIDFAKEYPGDFNVCKWRVAGDGPVVTVSPLGWVSFNYSYQDNTATYAWNHVTVDEDQDVHVHVRADDDFVLFVNGRLQDGYVNRGRNGSDWLWWRGPAEKVSDSMRLPVRLRAGKNTFLLKVKNRRGPAGFVLAVSRPDGGPVMGLEADVDKPALKTLLPPLDKTSWKTVTRHVFRSKSFSSKLDVEVGSFKVVNRRLVGQAKDKRVAWRKYTVRPGFPKDAPSNLAWFPAKHTAELEDFRLTLELAPAGGKAPKLTVTCQGEGGADGLSGWTLIVHPGGKGKVQARVERYDRVVYQVPPREAPQDEVQELVVTVRDRRLSASLGSTVLFEQVPITPIPDRDRIGFATFGAAPGIVSFRLETPEPPRR